MIEKEQEFMQDENPRPRKSLRYPRPFAPLSGVGFCLILKKMP